MPNENFPIVCIGGSAGAVPAIKSLIRELPAEPGLAIVVLQHRRGRSVLPELLSTSTSMPVHRIVEAMRLELNHVYVVPPKCDLTLSAGAFHLSSLSKSHGWPNVITIFLKSLADDWSGKIMAVILSGLDSDGAPALKSVKAAGGVTFIQKRETAEFPDMPISALETGYVDFELSVKEIARELVRIAHSSFR